MLRKLLFTYSNTYSGGYDSSRVNSRCAGQRRFFGGTFVATYKCLPEFARRALPSNSSLCPLPYAHAVSKKLHPRSIARCNDASDSASSEPVHPAIPHMPYPISLTCQPVRPNRRNFMRFLLAGLYAPSGYDCCDSAVLPDRRFEPAPLLASICNASCGTGDIRMTRGCRNLAALALAFCAAPVFAQQHAARPAPKKSAVQPSTEAMSLTAKSEHARQLFGEAVIVSGK